MLLIQGGLGTALALVIGYGVAAQGLRPLKRVIALAQRIHAGRLDERLNMAQGPREVVEVADTFDGMLGRIREQFDQQRKFVADVSHELRTPLTALQGNIDVLLLDPTLPADVAMQLRLVSAECARLIRLATNLLYVAQAELDRPPDRREVDLHELCIEVFHQMRDIKPGVAVRLAHEDQAQVIGDRDRLKQLLLNLVDNAIKYTPAGGTVSLGLHRELDSVKIVVTDTGIGIPEDRREAIFQRFYTIDQRTDRTVKGAGLGLSIVDWVVKSHDGTIEVDSEPGKGSTFTVTLPAPEGELLAEDEPAEPAPEAVDAKSEAEGEVSITRG
jgi:signal transduction histidine kinase